MAIITIFSASFCQGTEAAEQIARRTGCRVLSDTDLIAFTEGDFSAAQLRRALAEPLPQGSTASTEKRRGLAQLRLALATAMLEDGLVYHGAASQLLCQPLSHLLKIGLSASRRFRLEQAAWARRWTADEARLRLQQHDRAQSWLTQHLHGKEPFDPSLYDLLLARTNTALQQVVDIVVAITSMAELRHDEAAQQTAQDFLLAARVDAALTDLGYDVDVELHRGRAWLYLRQATMTPAGIETDLERLARAIPGVEAATVTTRPRARGVDRVERPALEQPIKVLVVGDDVALIRRLSEALERKGLLPLRAITREQAISLAFSDEPAAVLLDLGSAVADSQDLLVQLKRQHPPCAVVALSPSPATAEARTFARLGAAGYLPRGAAEELILGSVLAAVAPDRSRTRRAARRQPHGRADRGRTSPTHLAPGI